MKKPQPNPDYKPLDINTQRDFIKSIQHKLYKRGIYSLLDRPKVEQIPQFYREGRAKEVLTIPYEEFKTYFFPNYYGYFPNIPETPSEKLERSRNDKWLRRWNLRYSHWYNWHGVYYREKQSYRRQIDHQKKESNPKQEWREFKGIAKDKRRPRYRRSAPKFYKKMGSRLARRALKQDIHNSNWDNWIDRSPREFMDRWDWD